MNRTVTLLGEDGAPMRECQVELLQDGKVVAQSTTDESGMVRFDVEGQGPFRVRLAVRAEDVPGAEAGTPGSAI